MKNIIIAGAIVVIGAIIFLAHPFKGKAPADLNVATTTTTTTVGNATTTPAKPIVAFIPEAPEKMSATDMKVVKNLQDIWNQYLTAAKAHDVKTTSSLSYQISDYCSNVAKYQKECFDSMDALVKAFANIKTTDFTIAWYDSKQAILMTTQRPATLDGNIGFYQPRIFFGVKDGTYKLLAIFPDWGRFANKDSVKAVDVQAFLEKGALDSDKDGLTDMEENCDNGGGPGSIPKCTKTDPLVRDENHNGWWDGVEAYIRPITN